MAKLAEKAYRVERDDDTSVLLTDSYWDAQQLGLLAGERLLVDLQTLERRFLETDYRALEVTQPFSLSQLDPVALVKLRETGSCEVKLDELFFDLLYPGQYQRQIKAVQLTIPCVTGPYTNVSATLKLLASWLRRTPTTASNELVEVPLRRSVSIATSTAQQDAGMFELNFRDDRYTPFELAGAVSQWELVLPHTFRSFDYRTISDVIIHVTYTARADDGLRARIEDQNAQQQGELRRTLADHSLVRVFSLRGDLPGVFDRLVHSPAGTDTTFHLGREHLPLFLAVEKVKADDVQVALVATRGQSVGAVALRLDGQPLTGFTAAADLTLGGLPSATVDPNADLPAFLGEHTVSVTDAGDLGVDEPASGDTSAVDAAKLRDILLIIRYRLGS
jgi:hypothetical protein